jgi:arginyl-tRNA synthetase
MFSKSHNHTDMTPLSAIAPLFEVALAGLVPDAAKRRDYVGMIKPAGKPEHGDYQANMAMSLAKALGQSESDVAAAILAALPANDVIATATVAGRGYINIRLSDAFLITGVQTVAGDDRLGIARTTAPKTIVIDFGSPNVAKPLHVGHLRSTIIGDALVRILRFQGHTVLGDNHLGDWGTQFGMLIWGYRNLLDKAAYHKNPVKELARLYVQVRTIAKTFDLLSVGYHKFRDDAEYQADPMKELARLYVNGLKREKDSDDEDEDAAKGVVNPITDAYRTETAKLHAGDAENVALWREFMPFCMQEIHSVYARLGICKHDTELGESFYNSMLPGVVDSLLGSGLAEPGEGGAIIVRTGKDQVSLIRKRDGAFTYATTDLATIEHCVREYRPDARLYVVDFRQSQHFRAIFELAKKWGYDKIELTHVSFGSITGGDGKALKTRDGTAVELAGLLDEAEKLGVAKYRESYLERKSHGHDVAELADAQIEEIGRIVGIGAVKYADLSQNRTSDYRFDPKKMLATDGNTATYMQYAYARARSIFRKGNVDPAALRADVPAVTLATPAERTLALQLLKFGEALDAAAADYLPHQLTTYLWDLAKAYSQFFEACPVLAAESVALKQSRLVLVDLVSRVLKQTLDLLGIGVVERM